MAEQIFTAGVLTVSDKGSQGQREDKSGAAITELLDLVGIGTKSRRVVPDELDEIKQALVEWSDMEGLDLIVTTGGTGFSARDVTPEATLAAVERLSPGISEAMRLAGLEKTPKAMLSRGVSGIRGKTLIINLPGSEKGVRESLEAILPALAHGLEVLTGKAADCGG